MRRGENYFNLIKEVPRFDAEKVSAGGGDLLAAGGKSFC